jgi:hypothetical protein
MTPMSRLMIAAYERHQIIITPTENWQEVKRNILTVLPEALKKTRKHPIVEIRTALAAYLYFEKKLRNWHMVRIFNMDNSTVVYYKKTHEKWYNFDPQYTEIYNMIKRGDYNELRTKYL